MPNLTVTRIHLRNANPLGEGLFLWHSQRSVHEVRGGEASYPEHV